MQVAGPGKAENQSSEMTSLQGDISPTWEENLEFIHLVMESGAFQEDKIAGPKEERSDTNN